MSKTVIAWLVAAFLMVFAINATAALVVGYRVERLQGNICAVIDASHAAAAKDAKFWSAAAARARTRALTDTGNAKAADLDSAAADHLRAVNDINATQTEFPGC